MSTPIICITYFHPILHPTMTCKCLVVLLKSSWDGIRRKEYILSPHFIQYLQRSRLYSIGGMMKSNVCDDGVLVARFISEYTFLCDTVGYSIIISNIFSLLLSIYYFMHKRKNTEEFTRWVHRYQPHMMKYDIQLYSLDQSKIRKNSAAEMQISTTSDEIWETNNYSR